MKKLLSLLICVSLLLFVVYAEPDVYHINEPATTRAGITITLLNITESKGSYFITPDSGKVFLLAEFLVENNTRNEVTVSTLLDFDAYADDFALDYDFAAIMACENTLDVTLKSGKKAKGQIAYSVDRNWRVFEVEYKPDFWSSESYTFIYDKYNPYNSASTSSNASGGLGVVYVQPSSYARTSPSFDAPQAAFIEKGGSYSYYELSQGWYKIKLEDGSFAYIYSSRCEVIH